MLYYASLFFIISAIALALMIFSNILSGVTLLISKASFVIFVVLFVVSLVASLIKKYQKTNNE